MSSFYSSTVDWKSVSDQLLSDGIALIALNEEGRSRSIVASAFDSFHTALPELRQDSGLQIKGTDAAHVTGYHGPSKQNSFSSKYNQYREGIVLSDGARLALRSRSLQLDDLETLLYTIAVDVLKMLEQDILNLPGDWLDENMGPFREHSQWHLKTYHWPGADDDASAGNNPSDDSVQQRIWLPTHTDPSLLSVVLLDRPGIQPGGQGLQVVCCNGGVWKDVECSGHGMALVLIGSVLSYMTNLKAARHRVVMPREPQTRTAATFFLRPAPSAALQLPAKLVKKRPITFQEWNARVSNNYKKNKEQRR